MALIKSAQSDQLVKGAIVLDMGDLARQADRLMESARAQAAEILSEARRQAAQLTNDADARGYADGFARGMADGRSAGERDGFQRALDDNSQKLQHITENWSEALKHWEAQRANMLHEARVDVIRFAFSLARKVVHRLIQTDSTIVRDQVAAALAILDRPTAVDITIHPSDRPLLDRSLGELLATLGSCAHASVREDSSMSPGGCVVRTVRERDIPQGGGSGGGGRAAAGGGGAVDARIETQLDRIAEALVPGPNHCIPSNAPAATSPNAANLSAT